MNASLVRTTRIVLVAVTLGACANAFAGQELLDVDSRFRAKIAKEKVRIGAQERRAEEQGKSQDQNQGACGSQSIGNIDTGGRVGAAPREVFVFAPNAINIVGRGSCR
ncbi:hypothetical protein VAR608DRAFT_1954 [Variovorax sp. HW608]|uniref:hypothetical protein n=1 Tax=Variovorax sp. HW608 TaxID=1034889 RepID=UPI00081FCCD0|nr:hypothetical protein [Variovorax sp. HW608]SCK24592.1 hypothetical protein VAR608DRAFT_1954 [Variovorax sp. HW608]